MSEPGKAFRVAVGQRYLETLGTAPLPGREFDHNDTARSRKTVMVNEAFVREFLGKNPVGRVLSLGGEDPKDRAPRVVVGVVRDIAHTGVRQKAEPTVYLPDAQIENPFGSPGFILRASLPASVVIPALRQTFDKIGPDMWRTAGEIGIRMALGAERSDVLFMVLRDALLLIAGGLAAGLPFALFAGRAVSSVLFGIQPGDPAALITTICALIAAGLAAAVVPARRAASMDPMRALRQD